MSSKAKKLHSASFGAAAQATSARRQLIAQASGDAPADLTRVPVDQLVGNPDNPRENLGDLQELATSLKQHGLRQPVSVMPSRDFVRVYPQHEAVVGESSFVVINGNRRLAAAKEAGLATLAVHVTELDDGDAVRIAVLVENIHRQDLAPLEEAAALRELVSVYGSNAEVARQLSKSRVWVGQRLALLDLLPPLKKALREGSLKLKDARRLGTLPPKEQEVEWERVVNPVYNTPSDSDEEEVLPDPPQPSSKGSKTPPSDPASGSSSPESEPRNSENPSPPSPESPEEAEHPVQLTLDLQWEPTEAANEIVSAYGRERAEQLAAAILERL